MKVIAFAASNSKQSINALLAFYAAEQLPGASVETLDINDYEMPIFSMEREEALGQPDQALAFRKALASADALIVSFAEHNGNLTAAYKNLFDWASRIDAKVYQDKPVVFLATSPGKGGAKNVLANVVQSAPYFGANLRGSLSIPNFYDNFDTSLNKVTNPELEQKLINAVQSLVNID